LSVTVRAMVESDLQFAVDLANQEHWDYDLTDLNRLRHLFPKGCFVAEHDGIRAGWVVACTYGSLAWISSLVVRDNLRGQGVGAALVKHLVEYARKLGIGTVGLYSYRKSIGFYERIGFKHDSVFEHLEGSSQEAHDGASIRQVSDTGEIAELDRKYFRANREPLLRLLHEEYPHLLLSFQDAEFTGYIAGKSFSDGSAEIGPWVCEAAQPLSSEHLFASELSRLKSRRIGLTIPVENFEAQRIVQKYGFRVKQRVFRMFLGKAEDLPRIDGIHAAAGLDVG